MKVIRQDWFIPGNGFLTSISKDREQLLGTIAETQPAALSDEEVDEDVPRLESDAEEVEIPDDCPFADMVQNGTVFLHNDEVDILYNN